MCRPAHKTDQGHAWRHQQRLSSFFFFSRRSTKCVQQKLIPTGIDLICSFPTRLIVLLRHKLRKSRWRIKICLIDTSFSLLLACALGHVDLSAARLCTAAAPRDPAERVSAPEERNREVTAWELADVDKSSLATWTQTRKKVESPTGSSFTRVSKKTKEMNIIYPEQIPLSLVRMLTRLLLGRAE